MSGCFLKHFYNCASRTMPDCLLKWFYNCTFRTSDKMFCYVISSVCINSFHSILNLILAIVRYLCRQIPVLICDFLQTNNVEHCCICLFVKICISSEAFVHRFSIFIVFCFLTDELSAFIVYFRYRSFIRKIFHRICSPSL